eukprot:PITA_13205
MLHEQGLPLHLWAEAFIIAVYIQNTSLHRILGMKIPEETFSYKRLDVGHFKIFGSSVYCHLTKDVQKKLEPTTELGIFVGYTTTPQNYWVYFPTSRRIVAVEELLVPKEEEPQTDVKHPHVEVPGVETSTQEKSSKDGWKQIREADRLLKDVRENVGEPSSSCRQRRSPERYNGYMALAGECVETEPYSFEEAVQ